MRRNAGHSASFGTLERDHLLDYALIWAALHGRLEVVEFLLGKQPDLTFTEPFHHVTARGAAGHGRHQEIVAMLDDSDAGDRD